MKFINPGYQVSRSKNKKVIKICFGTHNSGTPCMFNHEAMVANNPDNDT